MLSDKIPLYIKLIVTFVFTKSIRERVIVNFSVILSYEVGTSDIKFVANDNRRDVFSILTLFPTCSVIVLVEFCTTATIFTIPKNVKLLKSGFNIISYERGLMFVGSL